MGSWERGGCCCCTKGWVGGCAVDPFRGCLIDRIIVGGDGWGGGGGVAADHPFRRCLIDRIILGGDGWGGVATDHPFRRCLIDEAVITLPTLSIITLPKFVPN